MSRQLVGYENLPNAFIEKIELFDYDKTKNLINFSVLVHDLPNEPIWSNSSEIFNQMIKVGFVISTDLPEINRLIDGDLNPLKAKKLFTKKIEKHSMIEESKIYSFHFKTMVPVTAENVYVFAFCFIDKKQILEKMKINVAQDYVGPIKCEKIVENGSINTVTNVFLRQNGKYWAGPVHQHETGFMIGSYHVNTPHEPLTRLEISNTKLKDLRFLKNPKLKKKEENSKFVSQIFVSKNNKIDINSVFMINFKSFLKNKSSYGSFLRRAQDGVINSLVDSFVIKSFSVIRQRVKKDRLKVKRMYNQKNILRSYDTNGALQTISRFEKNGHHDIILENLRSETDVDYIVGKNEIFLEHLPSYKKIASIKEIFLDYGSGIRTFQLNDYELSYNTYGEYQYKIELILSDPTRNFLRTTLDSLSLIKSNLKTLISAFKTGRIETNNIDISYIINQFIQINSYIYETDVFKREQMIFKLKNMLNLSTTNLQSLNKVMKMINELHSEMLRFLKFDSKLQNKNKKISISSKESTINTIFLNHNFNTSFVPSNNEIAFSYLEDSKDDFIKIMTPVEIQDRTNQEVEKNFAKKPKFNTPIVERKVIENLNDIRSLSSSYLSPIMLKDRDLEINLKNMFNVPFSQFNKSFNKNKKVKGKNDLFSIRKPPASAQEFTEDDGDALIESSKTLGEDSEFVRYSDVLEDYNIIDEPLFIQENLENINSSIDAPRSTPEVFENVKKLDEMGALSLPVQIKSILNTLNDSTSINYVNLKKDSLSKPETKNFFEVNNFSVQQIIVLKGFELDGSLNLSMDKPIFAPLTQQEMQTLEAPVICLLRRYTNNKFKISDSTSIPITNSLFILSNRDINVKTNNQNIQAAIYSMQNFSYEFLNSVIVVQANQPVVYNNSTTQPNNQGSTQNTGTMTTTPTNTGNY